MLQRFVSITLAFSLLTLSYGPSGSLGFPEAHAQEIPEPNSRSRETGDGFLMIGVAIVVGLTITATVTYFAAKAGAAAAIDEANLGAGTAANQGRRAGAQTVVAPAVGLDFSPLAGTLRTSPRCTIITVAGGSGPDWTAYPGMRAVTVGQRVGQTLPVQFDDGRFGRVQVSCFAAD